jgi:preprotein translocase subunit SecG
MFTFLLIVQTLVAIALVTVILMQRSEGGGLGVSSSSAGLMTARGAADFLTRSTAILAGLFIVLSIALAALAAARNAPTKLDTSLAGKPLPAAPAAPAPGAVPMAPTAPAGTASAPAPTGNSSQGVPLAK